MANIFATFQFIIYCRRLWNPGYNVGKHWKMQISFQVECGNVFINMHERHEASSFLQSASYAEWLPFVIPSAKYKIYLAFLKEPWRNVDLF